MTIQRKPKNNTNDKSSAENFVDAAEETISSTLVKTKKIPVALRFDSNLLNSIDEAAVRRGTSRNAIISYWCSRGLEAENKDY